VNSTTKTKQKPKVIQHDKPQVYKINSFHQIYGRINPKYLQQTAKHYNIKLIGTFQPCSTCSLANIHNQPISKENNQRSTKPGERIFIDISKLTNTSLIGNKFWLLIVDDATDYTWSIFLQQKSQTTERITEFLQLMKSRNTPVSYIRCDNSGENNLLKKTTHLIKKSYFIVYLLLPHQL
jgi:hypothetical protein